jgi:hypothetical protein
MNLWWHCTVGFREFGRCVFVAFRKRLTIAASLDRDLWYLAK